MYSSRPLTTTLAAVTYDRTLSDCRLDPLVTGAHEHQRRTLTSETMQGPGKKQFETDD
jgi:patatin-like phospholipase/acyl hydrolase